MASIRSAAVLAAGHGSRIQTLARFKPALEVGGRPLVDRLVDLMGRGGIQSILCAFNSAERSLDFSQMGSFRKFNVERIHVDTPSSMHTLWEVFRRRIGDLRESGEDHFFVSMVDTLITVRDFQNFLSFCSQLKSSESAVLTTSYIEDEKPLIVKLDTKKNVCQFGGDFESGDVVTSGMYCFSTDVYELLEECIKEDLQKMRRFLAAMVEAQYTVRSFHVKKTVDIDRPEDVRVAEDFLKESRP